MDTSAKKETCQVLIVRGKDRGKICGKASCVPANDAHVTVPCCGLHYRSELLKPPETYRKHEKRLTTLETSTIPPDYLAFIIQ